MAQAISNLTQSTNPFAGLLGLNPKPLAGSMQTSTAQTIAPKAAGQPNNFSNIVGQVGGAINTAKNILPTIVGNEYKAVGNGIAGLYNYATAPSGTSYSQANPSQPFQYSPLIPQQAPTTQAAPVATAAPVAPVNNPTPTIQQATPQPVASTTVGTTPTVGGANSGGTMNPNYALQTGSTAPTTTASGTRGLFPDILSSLAVNSANRNNELAANAKTIADDAAARIADVGRQGARFAAGQRTTGTTPVAEGNAAITQQSTAAEQAAIAAGAQASLTGNAQGITAQGQTQSALSQAGALAQPSTAAYGQTVFDPVTGQYSGGGGLPAEVMQQYAQMAVTGQYSAIPSFITSNPVLNAQLNVAAKGLNPNFTPIGAQGASGVLGNIPALQSASTAAEGIKNTINTYLQSNPQLNPSDLAAGNLLNQWIQGKQLTDPKYQTLFNYLDEYTNTLAPILGVGGNPTNFKTQIAQGFVNAAASGQSITQVLNAMSTLASNKIQDMQNGALGGGTTVPNTTGGGTGGLFDW